MAPPYGSATTATLLSLPPEIRDDIYKHVVDLTASRYVDDKGLIKYHPYFRGVFLVNRQLYAEAGAVFRRVNAFVDIKTPWPEAEKRIAQLGRVPILASGEDASSFNSAQLVARITTPDSEDVATHRMILHMADLETFTSFWRYSHLSYPPLNSHLGLELHLQQPVADPGPLSLRMQRQLLMPWGHIKDLNNFFITGNVDAGVAEALKEEMAVRYPSQEECLAECTRFIEAGSKEFKANNFRGAIEMYNQAHQAIFIVVDGKRRDIWGEGYFQKTMESGPYQGQDGIMVTIVLRVRLVANTMMAYMKLENYDMVRHWGERTIALMRDQMEDADVPRYGFAGAQYVGKIYYRCGVACKNLDDMSKAREYLRVAASWLPEDPVVKKEVAATALRLD